MHIESRRVADSEEGTTESVSRVKVAGADSHRLDPRSPKPPTSFNTTLLSL